MVTSVQAIWSCVGPRHAAFLAGAALLVASPSWAQQVPQPEQAEDLAAKALSRDALADFKLAPTPGESDYRITAELLRIACSLSPQEPILLRWYIEAAAGANQPDKALEATKTLVGLDPRDTVAQLRLITGRISNLQSVDQRIAAYDRFLGPEGEQLDAALRSRLALDAALLWRERGDLQKFSQALDKSVELDPTNKDAATLALTFFAERVPDAAGRLDLLLGVLYADPFDPDVHRAVAHELAASGAYTGAARFLATLDRLELQSGITPTPEERAFRDAVDWNLRGAETVARGLTDRLDEDRKSVLRRRQEMTASRQAADDVPSPEDVRLPFSSERTRLLAATASGQRELAAVSMGELAETGRRLAQALADPAKRPKDIPESEVLPRIEQILGEIVWLRLWTDQQLDQALLGLTKLHKNSNADASYLRRLDAWALLRKGETDAAQTALGAIAATDPYGELGLAVLAEKRNDRRAAVISYMAIAKAFGADLLGAYARTRVAALAGAVIPRSDIAKQMENIASAVPDWLEGMITQASHVVSVEAQPENSDVRLLERTPVRITVTNVAPIPLAVGADKAINSRFLLAPVAEVLATPTASSDLVEVVALDRRLRLLPREQFDATVWADAGQLGLLLDLSSSSTSRVRWRVIQGFELTPGHGYDAGPHCASTDTPNMVRRASTRFLADAQSLIGSMETGGPRELGEAILAVRARQSRTNSSLAPLSSLELDAFVDAGATRFRSLSKPAKILFLSLLPTRAVQPQVARIDAIAGKDSDPDVLTVEMSLRAASADDPVFENPAVENNPDLKHLSELVKARLKTTRRTFSTQETDVKPVLAPPVGPPRPDSDELRK